MSNSKPIVIKAQALDNSVGVVRLTPEAERVVRRLHNRCHLPIRQIVSEIIVQSENLIDIVHADMVEDEI